MITDNVDSDCGALWRRRLAPYRKANDARGLYELTITVVLFVAAWLIMLLLLQFSFLLALAISVPAAGLLVRLFMIQHDCGHGALFSSRRLNDNVGRLLGVLTLTPYDFWRQSHAIHHASSGNLERRGVGDIATMTVSEYLESGYLQRLAYRLYRHPLVMFGLGPIYYFFIQQRMPIGAMDKAMPWISTQLTNAGIILTSALLIYALGLKTFLLLHIPILVLAASFGVWLFYVQHQFDTTVWDRDEDWSHAEAALHGSSFYDLPAPLMWLSGNIGCHHVHHLSSRIPFHALPSVMDNYPELKSVSRLTIRQSLQCVKLALWDDRKRRLVSFSEALTSARCEVS
ncbi:MAG: fatty acid desaturase [Hyphomicrobiales bacterium]